MVLTRLSHVGEVCPLGDHSYSDPHCSVVYHAGHSSTEKKVIAAGKGSHTEELTSTNTVYTVHILDFPTEILEKIFSYLTFKKHSHLRRVCKRFEQIASNLLNSTFSRLQSQLLIRFQTTKAQMPRRESARRKHSLARECDIIETMHMRLTLLQMTFGKHIDRKHCCFFAGEILDEVYRILNHLKTNPNSSKAFKLTDELFDLSTMAMEYFKDNVEPILPEISYFGSDFLDMTTRFDDTSSGSLGGQVSEPEDDIPDREGLPPSNMVLRKRIRKIRQGMKRYNSQLSSMKRALKTCKAKITDQNKQMLEYATRLEEYDKKFEESSRKFSTVLQELNKCKTELQHWRSMSPMHPLLCCGCGRPSSSFSDTPHHSTRREACGGHMSSLSYSRSNHGSKENLSLLPPFHQSGHSSLAYLSPPSPLSSVKNLEPLFDMEGSSFSNKALDLSAGTSLQTSVPSTNTGNYSSSGTESDGEFSKRQYSDDDSDHDIDTVGHRVKQRKRVKLEMF